MKEIKVAILGFGFMGKTHLYGYQTIPLYYEPDFKIKLAAVCNRTLSKAQAAQERYGFEMATDNEDEVFARKDIDVINICTPNIYHKEQILKALNAAKHVYCEKPVACGEESAQEILNHPNLEKVTTQTVFHNRFYPCTQRAKQLIEEGRIGRVFSFRARMIMPSHIDPARPLRWRNTRAESYGGVLYDLGSHVVDLVTWLLGPISTVYAKNQIAFPTRPGPDGTPVNIELDDASYAIATLQNGGVGTLEMSKLSTGKNTEFALEIHGEKGALKFDLMDPNWLDYYDNTQPGSPHGGLRGYTRIETIQKYDLPGGDFPPPRHPVGWIRGHVDCLYHFWDCVANSRPADPSLKVGLAVQNVLDKMYESVASNKEIKL